MIKNRRPSSAHDRWLTGWPARAVAGFFPRTMQSSPVTSGWVKRSIIVLITAVWFLNLHGAPQTNVLEFQSSIAEPGSIQWQINQSKSRQQQELYRKHLTIPDLLGTNIPLAANAYVAVSPPATTPPSAIPTNPLSDRLKIFFYAALFHNKNMIRFLNSCESVSNNYRGASFK